MQFEETNGPDQESLEARVQRVREAARDIPEFTKRAPPPRPRRPATHPFIIKEEEMMEENKTPGASGLDLPLTAQVQRVRRGLEEAVRQGRIPSGSAPYGYSYDPKTKTHTINPVEAPKVQKMFEMAAEGMTPGEIARSMNSEGLLTRRGGQWTRQGVRRILKNETLTGMAQFMGIRIKTVPIIGKAHFDLVQRLLGQRKIRSTPTLSGTIRLTGTLRCGQCGDRMTSTRTKDAGYNPCCGRDSGCDPRCNTHSPKASKWGKGVWNDAKDLVRDPIGTVEVIRRDHRPITQQEEQRITDWCRRTAPLLDGMDDAEKWEVLKILGGLFQEHSDPDQA